MKGLLFGIGLLAGGGSLLYIMNNGNISLWARVLIVIGVMAIYSTVYCYFAILRKPLLFAKGKIIKKKFFILEKCCMSGRV